MATKKKVTAKSIKASAKKAIAKVVSKAKTTTASIYRQGDVLIRKVSSLPEKAKALLPDMKLNKVVLAYGEVTGHAHAISVDEAVKYEAGADTFLEVISESANLNHEEHSTITLPNGVYEIVHQKEYANKDMSRRVAD